MHECMGMVDWHMRIATSMESKGSLSVAAFHFKCAQHYINKLHFLRKINELKEMAYKIR